jgi:Putative zinc-finger
MSDAMSDLTCTEMRDLAAELALGVLNGGERAAAIAHLDRCPECREHIEPMAAVGDGLLELLPASEPPLGFESRVMERLDLPVRYAPRRRLRALAAAAAIALAFGAGGWVLGATFGHDSTPAASHAPSHAPSHAAVQSGGLVTADLTSGGHRVGRVYAYPGSPGWVYATLDLENGDEKVTCRLDHRDGTTDPIGSFTLRHGYGYWVIPARVNSSVTGARVTAPDGTTLARAVFPSAAAR